LVSVQVQFQFHQETSSSSFNISFGFPCCSNPTGSSTGSFICP
jgi:hypothetical protein